MKKYLKALVLLLCVCLCWAGVAMGETVGETVGISHANAFSTALESSEYNGKTIKLIEDISFTGATVAKNVNVTIDLNGHKLSSLGSSSATICVNNGTTVTFTGGTVEANIQISSNGTMVCGNNVTFSGEIDNKGTLRVDTDSSATFSGKVTNQNLINVAEDATATFSGEVTNKLHLIRGTYNSTVYNSGNIGGGATFNGKVTLKKTEATEWLVSNGKDFPRSVFNGGVEIPSKAELNAIYEGACVTVKFYDGTTGVGSMKWLPGVKTMPQENTLTASKEGATFLGWYTASGQQVTFVARTDDSGLVDYTVPVGLTEDTTVYATWSGDNNTLTLDPAEGTFAEKEGWTQAGTGILVSKAFTATNTTPATVQESDLPTVTRDGYQCVGWEDEFGHEITFPFVLATDTTLFPTWVEGYAVSIADSYDHKSDVTAYLSLSQAESSDGEVRNTTTIIAKKDTTVYLHVDLGENVHNLSAYKLTADVAGTETKVDMRNHESTEPRVFSITVPASNVVVTPVIDNYPTTITMNAAPGKFDTSLTDSSFKLSTVFGDDNEKLELRIPRGSTFTAPSPAPTIEGEPWYTPEWRKEGETTAYDFNTPVGNTTTTLTAAWKFTVTFISNGGSGSMGDVTVYRDDLGENTAKYTLPECTFTAPAGKAFRGWKIRSTVDDPTVYKPSDVLDFNTLEENEYRNGLVLDAQWASKNTLGIFNAAFRGESEISNVEGGSVQVYASEKDIGDPTKALTDCTGIVGDKLYLVPQPNTGYTFRDCELIEDSEGTLIEKDDGTNRYYEYTFADSSASLQANFALKQHDVTFHANGGKIAGSNDEMTTVQVYHGEKVAKPSDPTSDKYTFTSWHKEISYGNLESTGFAFDTKTITEDTIIRAKWCATVKFDPNCEANEVTGEMNDIIFEKLPDWLTEECTYKREGYKFIGWCFAKTPDDDKLLYKVGEFVPVGRNVTLYAQWEQQQTVQANAYLYKGTDRDEAVTDVLDFYSDEACTAKITGDVTGYSGDKIYLKINLDTDTEAKVDANNIVVLFNGNNITANNGVYAITLGEYNAEGTTVEVQLPVKQYTVTVYKYDGGTISGNVYHGETFSSTELPTVITGNADGATFAGLYEKDSSGNYSSTAFDYNTDAVTRDMDLYARYKYTIKYNPAYVGSAFGDDTSYTQTIYWDEVSGTNTVKLAKSTFTDPEGKRRVVGWRTENDTSAQKVFDDEQAVGVNDLKGKTGDFDSEINLYAVWVEERTVTVKTSGGYTDVSAKIYTDAACSGEGTTSYTGIAGDSIYLKADAGEGSTFVEWEKTGVGILPALEKKNEGLSFVLGAGDAEITAKFNSHQYTVTFNGNGGEMLNEDEGFKGNSIAKTVSHGDTVSSITPERTGCTFKGWYEKTNNIWADEAFNFDAPIKSNITLYARWEVKVTFDPNGGTGSMEPQTLEPNKPTVLQKNTFTMEGYRFAGWFDADQLPDNREPIPDQEKVSYSSNVTLYAQWEEERTITAQVASEFANQDGFGVQIYKDSNYAGASAASVKAIEGETLYLKATMPEGYKVKQNGWSMGANDPGTISPNGYEHQAKFTVGEGNATITVDFELVKYGYTFDANGGKFANGKTELTGSVEHGSTITPPTEIPTYSDDTGTYTFAGWYYSDKSGTEKEPFDFSTPFTKGRNFIAKWNATVTYDANGANNFTGPTQTGLLDSEITLLTPATTPTRPANAGNPYQHYQFNGWNTAQDGSGTHYDAGAKIDSLRSNMTLYAEWKNVWGVQVRIDSANTDYIENVEIYKNYSDGVCSQLLDTATSEKYGSYVGCVAHDKLYLKVTLKEGVECRNIKLETESGTPIGVYRGSGVFRIDFEENHINIVVKTELQKYTVKFDADGGNLPSYDDNRQFVSHGKTAYKPSEPTRSGMVFMGWFEKDENGAFFPEEFDFNTPITKGYFLYAKWGYTVTYKPGYESSGQDDVVDKVEASKSYTLRGADTFTRNGYDLAYWEGDGGTAKCDTNIFIGSNVVYTAQWKLKKYDLIFDADGGYIENTNKPTEVTEKVPFGSNIDNYFGNGSSSIPSAERTGYYFTGWYEKENGELKDNAFNFDTTMPANDVHLYAKWEKLYTVTLHRHQDEDDTGTLKMGEYCKGADVTLLGEPHAGWEWESSGTALPAPLTSFVGWNTKPDGTGTAYDASETFTMPGEDVNLYAQWRSSEGQQNVTVTYYANAGDTQGYGVTELHNASTHTLLTFEKTELTKVAGKKFVGWRVGDATTGTPYQAGDKINLLSTDIKVYAQWGDCTVTVKCDPESAGTATHVRSDNTVTLSHNAADGYVFDKWTVEPNITISENSFTMPDADVTVTAHFAKLHTVTFDAGNGHFDIEGNPATVTVQVKDNTAVGDAWPAVPVREHREFVQWEDEDGEAFKDSTKVTRDMTLGAFWKNDKHTVTLDYNGGKEDGKEDTGTTITDIECGTTLKYNNKTLPTVKRDGFTFYAWYIMEDGNRTERRLATDVEIKDDITAKARWMYTVKFAAGAGDVTGTQADATGYDDAPVTIPECTYEREGYDFIVWWDTSGKGYGAGERFRSLTGNVTLTAGWKIQQRKVTFDANGGTFKPEGQEETSIFETSVGYGGTPMPSLLAQLNSIICREGHEFKGWYTDQACTVAFDAEKAEIKTDITLYAKWELIQHNVTFDAGNGWWGDETETHAQTAKAAYGTTATAPADPVQTSGSGLDLRKYSFDGWFTQAEGGDPMSSVTIDKDTTFYAHWTTLYRVRVEDMAGNNHPKIHLKADHSDKGESEVWKPVGTTLYLDANPSAGYRLDQWPLIVVNGTYTVEADNVTINATYVKQVKVTFDATMGGTFPAGTGVSDDGRYLEKYVDENSSITPPSPEPQRGFDLLDGWLYDGGAAGDNTMPFDFDTMVISQDTMLYAQWKPGVGVVLDANGGTLAEGTVSPQRVPKGGKATKPADPSKDGCIFLGWYLEDAETPFDFEAALTQSVALYAHWKAEDKPTPTPTPTATSSLEPTPTPTATTAPTASINIIKQPTNTTAQEGGKATFTVEAQGDGMTYQWFVDRGDGKGFVPCIGATGATHTTTQLKRENNGYRYYCQITTKDGTLCTDTVTLTVEATIPKTGDSANLALWLTLTAMSCAGMLAMLRRKRQTK